MMMMMMMMMMIIIIIIMCLNFCTGKAKETVRCNDIWRLGPQGQKSHCCRPINNVKYIIFHCLYSLVSFLLMSQLHYVFFPKGNK